MFLLYLKDMLQLILSPAKGWEDISFDGADERGITRFGLCPFLLLTALTVPVQMLYHADLGWLTMLQQGIITFIKFLVTYYIGVFILSMYLPGLTSGEVTEKRVHTFCAYIVGIIAVIDILQNCIPTDIAVLYLLPVYVVFIIWRGVSYMTVEAAHDIRFVVMSSLSLILPAYLIQLLFNLVLPLV
jgi:hypothetical protein